MLLKQEAEKITDMIKGKSVSVVWRHRKNEMVIQFTDGTRLFVEENNSQLEISITGGVSED